MATLNREILPNVYTKWDVISNIGLENQFNRTINRDDRLRPYIQPTTNRTIWSIPMADTGPSNEIPPPPIHQDVEIEKIVRERVKLTILE